MFVRPGRFISAGREAGAKVAGVLPGPRTVLLCTFDGSDGATSAADSSPSGHTLTFAGNAQLDTGDKKFGTASLQLDGTGDFVSLPDSDDWDFAAFEPFTIDAWANLGTPGAAEQAIFARHLLTGDQRSFWLGVDQATTTPRLLFRWSANGVSQAALNSDSGAFPTGEWVHVAIVRTHSGTMRLFLNGVLVDSDNTSTTQAANFNSSANPAIGAPRSGSSGALFAGRIDQLRVIRGDARWTTDFTPPTAP